MIILRVCTVIGVALAAVGSAGCGGQSKPSDRELSYSNVWSADPGIDLFSRDSELVRATHESAWIVSHAGLGYAYPGYQAALVYPRSKDMEYEFTAAKTNDQASHWLHDTRETHYSHIVGYVADDKTVAATICRYVVPETGVDKANRQRFASDLSVVDLRLENTKNQAGTPGRANRSAGYHDSAAHRPPQWNVFGTWKITKLTMQQDVDPPACRQWFDQEIPGIVDDPDSKTVRVSDSVQFAPRPVATQYPEWIAPAK